MVKTNYYSGLNPVVVQALDNLQYRYSNETPEMWYSRIRYPFNKLLEYNLKYFSKNGFIHMSERSYKDGEFKAGIMMAPKLISDFPNISVSDFGIQNNFG